MQKEKIIFLFKERSFRATEQRIAVYNYVFEHKTHPDANEIYDNVIKNHPNFSKTTVYNALKSLCESGFIIPVNIDGAKTHYDANTGFHGHFRCCKCGEIFDFKVSVPVEAGLNEFTIYQKDIYYSGICPSCKNI